MTHNHRGQQQNNEKEEILTLDSYFKNTNSAQQQLSMGNQQSQQEQKQQQLQQLPQLQQQQQMLDAKIEDSYMETFSQAGVIYNGDNDDDFFGFPARDEIDVDKCVQELKDKRPVLSFNLMKCDIDDVRSSQNYEEFILESIEYLASNVSQNSEEQHQSLQYFVFNGVEDSLYTPQMGCDILNKLLPHITQFPEKAICSLSKRIENKFFFIQDEDNLKLEQVFKVIITYFGVVKSFLHGVLATSIRKMLKLKSLREIYVMFLESRRVQNELPKTAFVLEHLLVLQIYKVNLSIELKQFLDQEDILSHNPLLKKLIKRQKVHQ